MPISSVGTDNDELMVHRQPAEQAEVRLSRHHVCPGIKGIDLGAPGRAVQESERRAPSPCGFDEG